MTSEALTTEAVAPSKLLEMAISKDLDIDKLSKLLDLQTTYEQKEARKSFIEALSAFQANCPKIEKTKAVEFNGKVQYKYAPLSSIIEQIKDNLKAHGLAYQFEISESDGKTTVICSVSHVDGHTEKSSLTAEADKSGSKNTIQSKGSTITYLKRYSLTGLLGISSADEDDDGDGARQTDSLYIDGVEKCETLKDLTDYAYGVPKRVQNSKEFKDACYARREYLENRG